MIWALLAPHTAPLGTVGPLGAVVLEAALAGDSARRRSAGCAVAPALVLLVSLVLVLEPLERLALPEHVLGVRERQELMVHPPWPPSVVALKCSLARGIRGKLSGWLHWLHWLHLQPGAALAVAGPVAQPVALVASLSGATALVALAAWQSALDMPLAAESWHRWHDRWEAWQLWQQFQHPQHLWS